MSGNFQTIFFHFALGNMLHLRGQVYVVVVGFMRSKARTISYKLTYKLTCIGEIWMNVFHFPAVAVAVLCNVRCSNIMGFLCKTTIKRLGREGPDIVIVFQNSNSQHYPGPLYWTMWSCISPTKQLDVPNIHQTYTMCLLKVV